MRLFKYIALGLMFVGAASIQSASADSITTFLRNYLDLPSTVHSGFAQNQGLIQSNINTGLSRTSSEISSGVASGRLTPSEAATLNAELNRVTSLHNSFMADGGYTNIEVQQILSAFNNMNNLVASYLNNNDIASGTTFGGITMPSDWQSVISLQTSIRNKIRDGLDDGTLSPAEARMLRSEYYQISRRLQRRQMWGNPDVSPFVRQLVVLDRRIDDLAGEKEFAGRGFWWY